MLCLQHKDCLVLVPHFKVGSETAKGEQVQSSTSTRVNKYRQKTASMLGMAK